MVFVHVMRTDSWWNELQTSFAISYTIFPGIPSSVKQAVLIHPCTVSVIIAALNR